MAARVPRGRMFAVSYRGTFPVADWQRWRHDELNDLGRKAVPIIRSSAPSGYGGLAAASTYKIVDDRGMANSAGRQIDLRPREGGRVHPLYHIAEGGRGISIAGFNRLKAKSSGNGLTGRQVLTIQTPTGVIFRPMARGYRGTRYLSKAILGPIYSMVGVEVPRSLERYWSDSLKEVRG